MRCSAGGGAPGGPPNAGEPVNVTTGNVWLDHTDTVIPGVGGDLAFRRSYNSLNAFKNRGGAFGPGWHHSYERTVAAAPGTTRGLILRGGDGVPLYFQDNDDQDSTYKPFAPATDQSWLVKQPTNDYIRYFRGGGSEEYDLNGQLTALVDRWGNRTTLVWQGSQLTSIADEGGRTLTLVYEGALLTTVSGPAGLIATYEYQNGLLSKVTYNDEQHSGYQFTYWTDPTNGRRLLERVQDLETPVKTLEFHEYYAGTGKGKTSERGGGQEKLTIDYASFGKTKVTDARNNVTWYHYQEFAGLKQVVRIEGPCFGCGGSSGQQVQEWAYDLQGRVTGHKDGEGNVTTYTYDPASGDLLSESGKPDPNTTLTTTFTYHPDGRMHTRTDPRLARTTWAYAADGADEKQTITQTITSSLSRETVVWYNSDGKRHRTRDPRGYESLLFYRPAGDLDYTVDPAGKETHLSYDAMGRRTQVTPPQPASGPAAREPIFAYDTRGQVKTITDPTDSSRVTRFTYDRGGRRKLVEDALHRKTEYGYDPYGRLETVTQHRDPAEGPPSTYVTTYGYDAMSNLEFVRDARNNQTGFQYDGFNRLWKTTYPADQPPPREEAFTYYGNGRLKTRTDRRGIVTTYTYDGLGRQQGKSYTGASDPAVSFGYDDSGNLESAGDGTTSLSWTYDLAGQLEHYSDGQATTDYTYDLAGNRESLNLLATGFSLTYHTDSVGRLEWIRRGAEEFRFGYDDASRRRSLSYPNGVVTNLTPDSLSRLDVLEVVRGKTSLNRFDYGYDDVGNRTSKAMPSVNETYTYDAVYRLDEVRRNSTLVENFNHDAVGNRNGTLNLPNPSGWVYSNRNELLTSCEWCPSYGYDENGSRVVYQINNPITYSWEYEWDAENRLTHVSENGGTPVASYRYDPLGRRVEKLTGGVRTTYVYDGEDILRERVGNDDRYYIHGPGIDEPLARVAGTMVTYFHADGLGSIVTYTNDAGSVVGSRSYSAFGDLETGTGEGGYAFTGREWDPETGLYYYRARYYDPKIGRFLSEDPIGFEGGINFYAYVENNPPNLTDPLGLVCARASASSFAGVTALLHRLGRFNRDPKYWNLLIFEAGCPPGHSPVNFRPQQLEGASSELYARANPEVRFVVRTASNSAIVAVSVQTRAAWAKVLFRKLLDVVELCWDCFPTGFCSGL